jgi:hypothetical protein
MEPDEIDGPEPSQPVATDEPRRVWDKRADESQRAYSAFSLFRDSEKRSLKSVAASLNPACSVQNVFWWSRRHDWHGRCDAYDLHVDHQQRAEFCRSRVRMRTRHLQIAVALGGVAAAGIREWQNKIAAGAELNLMPEQITMLVKCATELERGTLGIDEQHHASVINILLGGMRYSDEPAEEGEGEVITMAEHERRQWESLTPDERKSLSTWKNPPKPRLTN